MNMKKLICLLLAVMLVIVCFTGCRGKKEDAEAAADQATDASTVQTEEPAYEVQVIDNLPEVSGGLEDSEELVIEVPEGSEIGGD